MVVVLGMEGQAEQAPLAPGGHAPGQVEEELIGDGPIGAEDADPARLFDDVQRSCLTRGGCHEDRVLEAVSHRDHVDGEGVQVCRSTRRLAGLRGGGQRQSDDRRQTEERRPAHLDDGRDRVGSFSS